MTGQWYYRYTAHFPPVSVLHGQLAHPCHLSFPPGPFSRMPSVSMATCLLEWVGRLTVHGDLDGQAADLADGILHDTAVQVIVLHEHAGDGEHLLVGGQEHPRVIEQGLAILQPGVAGLGAVLMGAVQGEVLAELQHCGRSH